MSRSPRGRRRRIVTVLGAALLLSSCSPPASPESGRLLPPPPQKVAVSMTEYRFVFDPPTRPGRTVFRVVNVGKEKHWFGMYRLPDDLPPLDDQLHGDQRRELGASMASMAVTQPGERNLLAVDLVPGVRYAFLCLLTAADEESHAFKGMNAEFRLPGPKGKP